MKVQTFLGQAAASTVLAPKTGQGSARAAIRAKIRSVQPASDGIAAGRPFFGNHRKPRRIPPPALHHQMGAMRALVIKAKPGSGAA
jgi:hypothetical protein